MLSKMYSNRKSHLLLLRMKDAAAAWNPVWQFLVNVNIGI